MDQATPRPKQTHGSQLAILASAAFASTFAGRTAEPLVGVMSRDLASTPETIALVTAAFALPFALVQPILGPVADSLGKELVIKVSLAVLALSLAASALAPNAATLFALRFLSGLAAGGVNPVGIAIVGDRFPMETRQVALGRYVMAVLLGQLCGSSVSGLLANWVGWRGIFLIASGLAVIAGVAFVAAFKGPSAPPTRLSVHEAAFRYRAILKIPRARALFLFVFIEAIATYGLFPYIAPLFETWGFGGPFEAGIVLAGFGFGGFLYTLAVGQMMRLGLRRLLRAGGAVVAAGLLLFMVSPDWRLDVLALLLCGFGVFMLHNPFQTQVTEVAPAARASAVSLHALSFFGGQALGVIIIGFGLGALGFAAVMILCAVAALLLGLAAAETLAKPFPQRPR
jgi:predicted MFS family arabinose efflux permease